MVYVEHISIWKTLWYMYNAAAGAFMRYAGGRLGRWGCSRLLNRVAPPGGDGGLPTLTVTMIPWSHFKEKCPISVQSKTKLASQQPNGP